jgi:hypothetical protein
MFAYNTVDFVDIATGWIEQRAVWGKGKTGVLEQIKHIEHVLPFPMLCFDCDNIEESSLTITYKRHGTLNLFAALSTSFRKFCVISTKGRYLLPSHIH